ncbi:MAG: CapA family protein [Saccharofermentanales bacterium]|jgi:hypothetical protein
MKNSVIFWGDAFFDRKIQLPETEAACCVFNLEYAWCDHPIEKQDKVLLSSNYNWIDDVSQQIKGQIIVCLANNHLLDCGEAGYQETVRRLEANQILYFGAGNKTNNYNNPVYLTVADQKIAFLGYDALRLINSTINTGEQSSINETAIFSEEAVLADIASARADGADKIVLSIHWGNEESRILTQKQLKAGKWLKEQDIDLIIGHHPHIVQNWEIGKTPIFYSLGNFYFPDFDAPAFFHQDKPDGIMYAKKQRAWNNQGLQVQWNVAADSYMINYTLTEDNVVSVEQEEARQPGLFMEKIRTIFRKINSVGSGNIIRNKWINIEFIKNELRLRKRAKSGK